MPDDCVLHSERFDNVSIVNGQFSLPIGTGTLISGEDPGLTLRQVMDNAGTISSLKCLDTAGAVKSGLTTFNPTGTSGARKLRLETTVNSYPMKVDFNIRSVAYAVNAEISDDTKKLNGKTDSQFVQTSTNITQSAVEAWFANAALTPIINGTYNAPTATSATTASALSTTLPVNRGGANLTSIGTANQVLGVNAAAGGLEYKSITAGINVTITHSANSIVINATGGGGGGGAETDPTVQLSQRILRPQASL